MKLLFSYTGPLIKDEKGNYYSRTITDKMLQRYFYIADEISILTRVKEVSDKSILKNLTKITSDNLNVIKCPNISSLKGFLLNKRKVIRRIESEVARADIVISRLPCVMGNITVDFAKRKKKPYMVEVVGCPRDVYWNHSYKGKLLALPSYIAMKNAVKKAPFALYVTNYFLQQRYPCEGSTIGCSDVSLPKTDSIILEKRLSKISEKKDEHPFIIGTTGAVDVKYKGQSDVIKLISELNKKGFKCEYHIAGGGDVNFLKKIAEDLGVLDKVKFLGSLPHEDVFDYLDNLDIYIQPSKTEGLPRALVEAMSRGCLSIGTNVGGIPELISKEYIFEVGSVTELYKIMIDVNKDKMKKEAIMNFNKAKEYQETFLEKKRRRFYKEFIRLH
ncbi:glycosyltransferase [Halobacillus kuroshimensis]|uniref:Glycosyltransferase n=1 Tax=Halobacillus kuroshimensis TaxID=302481 RepID=A0ABS3DUW5_9BACI|nr:glycosyltransferase [Halobacillus kuroshimensis]MBN8235139.1 glycosyltransferase [Halobacillus kuroshimensis]